MIRKATFDDIELIEATYNEHFEYELEHGAVTVFKKGIYPTKNDAEKAIATESLYVYEENGSIAGSMIVNKLQPKEYTKIIWNQILQNNAVMVIHLLIVCPSMAGRGIATALVKYAENLAKNTGCKALRLDTGSQNITAISLYRKLGFQIVATAYMKVGNAIEHNGHLFLERVL